MSRDLKTVDLDLAALQDRVAILETRAAGGGVAPEPDSPPTPPTPEVTNEG